MKNLKFIKGVGLLLLVTSLSIGASSCKSDSGVEGVDEESVNRISNLKIYDIENSGNGSDVLVEFDTPIDKTNITEFRIYLYKLSSTVTLEQVLALNNSSYLSLTQVSTSNFSVTLSASFADVDGEIINSDNTYKAIVASIGSNASVAALSEESNELSLSVTNLVDTIAEDINAGTGGLSIDSDLNLYLSDFGLTFSGGGDKVFKITPSGDVSLFATGLNGAAGSDFDSEGNLYQSNITGNTISKISADGTVQEYYNSLSFLNSPVGIIVDDDLNLFVTNCGNNSITKIDANKEAEVIASGSTFNCPNGITKDEDDNLYVTNFNNGNIIKVTQEGTLSTFKTLPGNQVTHPYYSNGYIYAVARADSRIYRIAIETGEEEIVAGSGVRGDRDGAGQDAQFTRPNDIAVTPDGKTIYINDTEISAADAGQLGPVIIRRIRLFDEN